jgi:fatty-acyl-CoA synthase
VTEDRPWPVATTIGGLLRRAASRWPDGRVVVGSGRSTWADLDARADESARWLIAAGVGPGDKVGILLEPGLDYLSSMFGIARIGATIVPINERFKSGELEYVIPQADLRMLLTTDRVAQFLDFPQLVAEAFPDLPHQDPLDLRLEKAPELRCIAFFGEGRPPGMTPIGELVDRAHTVSRAEVHRHEDAVAIRSLAFIVFTSGTSAHPKGCMISHEAFVRQGFAIAQTRYRLGSDDVFWCPLPLFHNGALITLFACMASGAGYVHPGRFTPDVAIDQLEGEGCTHGIPAFEALWVSVLDHPRFAQADLSRLRAIMHSGSPDLIRMLQARLPATAIVSNYGSTEAAGHLALSVPEDSLEVRSETCGLPFAGMEVRIVDPETSEPVPAGERGEIVFRGPIRFDGYYRRPDATAEAIDADGWYHSGDLGALDAEGRVIFVNRIKDMLKVGGENVAAAEVEAYLLRHEAVHDVQVVAAPDARYGEVPVAYVELCEGAEVSEVELIDFCVGRIATFKVPRYVRFVTDWPMSGTKVQKYVLRERIADELSDAGITEAPKIRSTGGVR